MDERIFVKPREGLKVQKLFADIGRIDYVSDSGEYVPNSLYYRRMLKRGELVIGKPQTTKKEVKK